MKKWAVMITVLIITSSGCVSILEKPTIESISNKWGDITHGETTILTTTYINNPNKVSIPLREMVYKIVVDGIQLGEIKSKNLQNLLPRKSNISFTTTIDNGKIPDVWIKHIQNGEKSIVKIEGYAVFDLKIKKYKLPISLLTNISTDILHPLNSIKEKSFPNIGINLKSVSTSWKKVDFHTTTIEIILTLYNTNNVSLNISKINFQIDANGIQIAKGFSEPCYMPPHSRENVSIEASINNDMIDEYWVSHLQNGERTIIGVNVTGNMEKGGKMYKISLIQGSTTFSTNITDMISGKLKDFPRYTIWKALPLQEISPPIVINVAHDWGEVSYGETEIKSNIKVYNPNKATTFIKINGEVKVDSISIASVYTEKTLPSSQISFMPITTKINNGKIPDIWVSHIQSKEKSIVEFKGSIEYKILDSSQKEYKLNVTAKKEISTNLLSYITSIEKQQIWFGRPLKQFSITVKPVSAEWGNVNFDTTTVEMGILIHNDNDVPIVIPRLNLTITDKENGILVAQGSNTESYVIGRNQNTTITIPLVIKNDIIDDCWIYHIRKGEKTNLKIDMNADIRVAGVEFKVSKPIKEIFVTTHLLPD